VTGVQTCALPISLVYGWSDSLNNTGPTIPYEHNDALSNTLKYFLNSSDSITTAARNSTFEEGATDWVARGSTYVTVLTATNMAPKTGTYSMCIVSASAGSNSNCAILPVVNSPRTTGKFYCLEFWVRHKTSTATITFGLGDSTRTLANGTVSTSAWVHRAYVMGSTQVDSVLKIYSGTANDSVFIDDLHWTEAYDITMSLWMRVWSQATTANERIMGTSVTPFATTPGFEFTIANTTRLPKFSLGDQDYANNSYPTYTHTDTALANTWYLFTVSIKRGDSTRAWINSTRMAIGTSSNSIYGSRLTGAINPTILHVGSKTSDASAPFKGRIGEIILIKGKAYSQASVADWYTNGFKYLPDSGTCVGFWRWHGNSNDSTGNNNLTHVGTLTKYMQDTYPTRTIP
jgi:hypothetical protein